MSMGDDAIKGSVPSLILGTITSKQSEDTVLQEDLAWADSCLIKDPDMSGTNWDSLTEALLDIASYQTDSLDSTPAKRAVSSWGADIGILPSSQEAGTSQDMERTFQINKEEEENSDALLMEEENVNLGPISNLKIEFLPTYKGEMRGIEDGDSDSDSELSYPAFGIDVSTEDIFKVWDLEIPGDDDDDEDDDDNELIKQLNKALSQSFLQPIPDTNEDSGVWKGLKDESLDDLVDGIDGLSLSKKSG